jgi:peptidoglycan/xylan/chitin deacetylase (PgdA/CDA1 family)
MQTGKFVVSLDFELQWGVIDHTPGDSPYRKNIERVHQVVPRLIDLFEEYNIHATFAAVGLLFFDHFDHLQQWLKKEGGGKQPTYHHKKLSVYSYFESVKQDKVKFYFAPGLIKQIQEHEIFEIASHTFAHYYCLEEGQMAEQFDDDLYMAKKIARENGIELKSLVFPRNQINENYLPIIAKHGFEVVRNNEKGWMYKAVNRRENTKLKRLFRLMDTYINISGHNCYEVAKLEVKQGITFCPASRFLRPYSRTLPFLEGARLRRIKRDMTYAARHGMLFHLWWHPHNFGNNTEENLVFLKKILEHYRKLHDMYGFESCAMAETAI